MSKSGKTVIRDSGKRGVLSSGKIALFNTDGTCVECCVPDVENLEWVKVALDGTIWGEGCDDFGFCSEYEQDVSETFQLDWVLDGPYTYIRNVFSPPPGWGDSEHSFWLIMRWRPSVWMPSLSAYRPLLEVTANLHLRSGGTGSWYQVTHTGPCEWYPDAEADYEGDYINKKYSPVYEAEVDHRYTVTGVELGPEK
jgi:hypothetical protein